MWVVGVVFLFAFYRFAFRWYFRLFFLKNPLQRPMHWQSGWFHWSIWAIAIFLLTVSSFCFYLTSPWLALAPIGFVPVAFLIFIVGRGTRTVNIISKSVRIQADMERRGFSQIEINRRIAKETIKDDDPVALDSPLDQFLKFYVLQREGLIPHDFDQMASTLNDIDKEIKKAKRRWGAA